MTLQLQIKHVVYLCLLSGLIYPVWSQTPNNVESETQSLRSVKEITDVIDRQTKHLEQLSQDEQRISEQLRNLNRLAAERKRIETNVARENIVTLRLQSLMRVLQGQLDVRNERVAELAGIHAIQSKIPQNILDDIDRQLKDPVFRDIKLSHTEQKIIAFRDSILQYVTPQDIDTLATQDFSVLLDWYLKVQYIMVEPHLKDFVHAYSNSHYYEQAMLMLGDIYRYQSRYDEAAEIFRTLTTRENTSNDIKLLSYAVLEDIYYRQQRWDDAITAYFTVADQFQLFPEDFDGAIYIAGDSYLRKALSTVKSFAGIPAPLAAKQQAQLDSAITIFMQISPISPLFIIGQEAVAQCYIEQGNLEKAIEPYKNAEATLPPVWAPIEILESFWSSVARLGQVYLELSHKEDNAQEAAQYRELALAQFGKVPQEAAIYDQVILALASLELERNNTENGVKLLETLLDIRPNSKYAYEAWVKLGQGYPKLKEYTKAHELFSQLIITQRAVGLIDSAIIETQNLDNIRFDLERISLETSTGTNDTTISTIADQLDSIANKHLKMLAMHTRLFESDPLAMELVSYGQLRVLFTTLSKQVSIEEASLKRINGELANMERQVASSTNYQDAIWKLRRDEQTVQQTQTIAKAFQWDIGKGLSTLTGEAPMTADQWLKDADFGNVNIDFTRYQTYKTSIKEQYELIGDISKNLQNLPPGDLNTDVSAVLTQLRDQVSGIESDLTGLRQQLITDLSEVIQHYPANSSVELSLFRLGYVQYDQTVQDFLAVNETYSEQLDRGDTIGEAPKADYDTPIRTYEQFAWQFPNSNMADQAYYQIGHLLSERGDLKRANSQFETLVQKYPDSPLVPDAYLRIGDFYFDALYLGLTDMAGEDLMKRAISSYDHVLDYPDNKNFQNALYKLGWSYYNLAAPEVREKEYDQSVEYFTGLLDDSLRVAKYNQLAKEAGIKPKQLDPGFDLTNEAIKYIAINFRDRVETGREDETRRWATHDVSGTMKRYIEKIGKEKPYAKPLMIAMADVYKETGQKEAEVVALDSLLSLLPSDPQSPRVLQRMIDGYEDIQQMALADPTVWKNEEHNGQSPEVFLNKARERLFREFGRKWADTLPDSADRSNALILAERAGWRLANYVASQAEAGGDPASGIEHAATYYQDYLKDFPENQNAYTARWNYAQYMWRLNRYEEAFSDFITVSRDETFEKYREQAALNAILAAEKMLQVENGETPSGTTGTAPATPVTVPKSGPQ